MKKLAGLILLFLLSLSAIAQAQEPSMVLENMPGTLWGVSPLGNLMALGDAATGVMYVVDANTGETVYTFEGQERANHAYFPTEDYLMILTPTVMDESSADVFDLASGDKVLEDVANFDVTPDGKLVASSYATQMTQLLDADLNLIAEFPGLYFQISQDGSLLVISGDELVYIVDSTSGEVVREIAGVSTANLNADNTYMSVWYFDEARVELHALDTGEITAAIEGCCTGGFSPDGQYFVTSFYEGSLSSTVAVAVASGEERLRVSSGAISFSHDTRYAIVMDGQEVEVLELETGDILYTVTGQYGKLSSDGNYLLTGGIDNQYASFYDGRTGETIATLDTPFEYIDFIPNSSYVHLNMETMEQLWDAATGELVMTGNVLRYSEDGRVFIQDGSTITIYGE